MMRFVAKEVSDETRQLLRNKEAKTPWQPLSVLVAAAVPVVLFAWVYYCGFSGFRFYHPGLAAVLGVAPGLALSLGSTAKARRGVRDDLPVRAPAALAASCWLAFLSAGVLSEFNYRWYNFSFYSYQDLADYANIDPSSDKGQSYMDAGQVYFSNKARIAEDQVVAFRSDGTYCAAPIVSQPLDDQDNGAGDNDLTVDFWAVGIDCCDQERKSFTCGAARDPRALAGLRLLRDDVRPFYALAVEQWNARQCPLDDNTVLGHAEASPLVCPIARHPLFFHWVVDPLAEIDHFNERATEMYGFHVLSFSILNLSLVLGVLWFLFSLGFK